jgi:branched-chain amino acid transport system permease protein
METFFQLLVGGMAQGSAYGLVAAGFALVFSVTGVVNLAQGQFAAIAAFGAIVLTSSQGWGLLTASLVALVLIAVFAYGLERTVIGSLYKAAPTTSIIVTLGLLVALEGATLIVFGPEGRALPDYVDGSFEVAGVIVRWQQVVLMLTALVVTLALGWFMRYTMLGQALRACAQQPIAARLIGIPQRKMYRYTFVLAAVVAGIAGLVISPDFTTTWDQGLLLGIKGFVAASLVGLGSVPGAVLAGVLVGVTEAMASGYIGSGTFEAVTYLLLLGLLMLRPEGLQREQVVRV